MSQNLVQEDIKLMRDRYDEALEMLGIPAKYQFPNIPDSNLYGEPVIDSYSVPEDVYIFFESAPKLKTFKRLGWVVEMMGIFHFLFIVVFIYPNSRRIVYLK